jgi:hypothetical protein
MVLRSIEKFGNSNLNGMTDEKFRSITNSISGGLLAMTANPFPEWLAEVATDAVIERPDDIDAEARGNLWSFSLSPEQAACVAVADVEAFAAGVVEGRRAWLADCGGGPMVLYWWHDAQAGQLRFSLVSSAHGRLPFACVVVPAESLSAVAADWLSSPHLYGVPSSELRALLPDEIPPDPPPLILPVWSVVLPQTPNRAMNPTGGARSH